MGLFDKIAGGIAGQQTEGAQPGMLESVIKLVNDPETGGISGLIQSFRDHGLGDKVSSWIGKGENQPISGGEVEEALGHDKVQQLGSKLGLSPDSASEGLAGWLPQVIDRLTPAGSLPEGGLLAQGLSMFGLGSRPTATETAAPGEATVSDYEAAPDQEETASGEEETVEEETDTDEDSPDPRRSV